MSQDRNFSPVAKFYNQNVFGLNEARIAFEAELKRLNSLIVEELGILLIRLNNEGAVFRPLAWSPAADRSILQDPGWLNFATKTEIALSVIDPQDRSQSVRVGYLTFEVVFDWEYRHQFLFQIKFEAHAGIGEGLEKKLCQLGKTKDLFKSALPTHAQTCILYSCALDNLLLENLNSYLAQAMELCNETVLQAYPLPVLPSAAEAPPTTPPPGEISS